MPDFGRRTVRKLKPTGLQKPPWSVIPYGSHSPIFSMLRGSPSFYLLFFSVRWCSSKCVRLGWEIPSCCWGLILVKVTGAVCSHAACPGPACLPLPPQDHSRWDLIACLYWAVLSLESDSKNFLQSHKCLQGYQSVSQQGAGNCWVWVNLSLERK